jgi:putative transposase
MARSFYSEIHLHLTWHTKLNAPMLTPDIEPLTHRLLRQKAFSLPGVFFHEVGGTEDHVHLAISVLPTVLISDLVGQLKGVSAHETNEMLGLQDKALQWQTGYGVVSFGTRDLAWVVRYIQRQKEHHATGKTHERLERITAVEEARDEADWSGYQTPSHPRR